MKLKKAMGGCQEKKQAKPEFYTKQKHLKRSKIKILVKRKDTLVPEDLELKNFKGSWWKRIPDGNPDKSKDILEMLSMWQKLWLHTSNEGGTGLILGQWIKIPHVALLGQKKKKKNKKFCSTF